eukprot:Lithocolla_globosa_v1_NODE_199_length_5224_cov_8.409618.p3 type:complete len:296 gc:universal NODE_199_length_5224_cov_8.409618:3212-2325(-)
MFYLLPRWLFSRAGEAKDSESNQGASETIKQRINMLVTGEWLKLDHISRHEFHRPQKKTTDEKLKDTASKSLRQFQLGEISRCHNTFRADEPLLEVTPTVFRKVLALYPGAEEVKEPFLPCIFPPRYSNANEIKVETESFLNALKNGTLGCAGGLSRMRLELLLYVADHRGGHALASMAELILRNQVPLSISCFTSGGNVTVLKKDNGEPRPIVPTEQMVKTAGRVNAKTHKKAREQAIFPLPDRMRHTRSSTTSCQYYTVSPRIRLHQGRWEARRQERLWNNQENSHQGRPHTQ